MNMLNELYQELILDHYKTPRNYAETLDGHTAAVHHNNPSCGDELDLLVRTTADTVTAVAFSGQGCAISVSSASIMTELVTGTSISDAQALAESFRKMMHGDPATPELGDAAAFEGVAKLPVRVKCALLGWMALIDALSTGVTTMGEAS